MPHPPIGTGVWIPGQPRPADRKGTESGGTEYPRILFAGILDHVDQNEQFPPCPLIKIESTEAVSTSVSMIANQKLLETRPPTLKCRGKSPVRATP